MGTRATFLISGLLAFSVAASIATSPKDAASAPRAQQLPAVKRQVETLRPIDAPVPANDPVADARYAQKTLQNLKGAWRYLDGATVEIGQTPPGKQAVAYYQQGRIVISPEHTGSINTILAHEMWHVIDYAQDRSLDWGEDVPPTGASTFARP